ncbi:MAG: hypothetical protein Q8P90_04315 [bacterium]|nr:hypothetical protein [bacterium]
MSRTITDGQWRDFWAKVQAGAITQASFQAFLDSSGMPNLEGLSKTFEVDVNGRTVTCAWIPANYFVKDSTNQEVIDEITSRHLRCPSRDVAVAAFDLKNFEMATNPSVAIDGVVQTDTYGLIVGCVYEDRSGRHVHRFDLRRMWYRYNRFLVVVSE